jgi:hypothetical protein
MNPKSKYLNSIFGNTSSGIMGKINQATGLQKPKGTPLVTAPNATAPMSVAQNKAPIQNTTTRQTMVNSPGATSPAPTAIKPQTSQLPPQASPFINQLAGTSVSTPTVASMPQPTIQPTATPKNPSYIDYMKTLFNPEQIRMAQTAKENAAQRAMEIQARNQKAELDAIAAAEKERFSAGGLQAGADRKIGEIGRKSSLESAYGAIEEGTAISAANLARDTYNDYINAGKTIYEAEQAANKAREGFTLGENQTRFEYNPTTGEYEQIGGKRAGELGTTSSPAVDAYIKNIRDGKLKISDVPNELKNEVALGMAQNTQGISQSGREVLDIVDSLLSNPKLNRISGTVDQLIGGLVNSDAKLAKNQYDQLVGILKLDNREKLKGSGAISDFEFRILGQAATALGRNLSDDSFRDELQKMKDKLSGNAPIPTTPVNGDLWKGQDGVEYEFKNGFWQELQSFNSVGNTTASAGNLPQRNKNPGNVKRGGLADSLAIGVDGQGHLIFPDEATGFKAMQMDIQAKINGQSRFLPANPTLAQLGKVYAEDPNWTNSVAKILKVPPTTKTASIDINKLIKAIARQEGYYA